MSQERNRQVLLVRRPQGWPVESDFRIEEAPIPALEDGEFLVRNHFLSLDPYMRGRMNDVRSYAPPFALGEVLGGGTVGEVVASRQVKFPVGALVEASFGWQLYAKSRGEAVRRIEASAVPLSAWLGVAGMPGITAYVGLLDIGQPAPGETVVVSGAAGAVGSVVGQIAKLVGCRVVGIAGGAAKCGYAVQTLGFDACIDYRTPEFASAFKDAVPRGVDVYFDNVGGSILDLVLSRMNPFARLPLCGLISQYNATEPYAMRNVMSILVNRIRVQGFIVSDYPSRWPKARAALAEWVIAGKLRYHETVADGLEAAPRAFLGLLRGENLGKQLVKLI